MTDTVDLELVRHIAHAMHAGDVRRGYAAHAWGEYPTTDDWYLTNARDALEAVRGWPSTGDVWPRGHMRPEEIHAALLEAVPGQWWQFAYPHPFAVPATLQIVERDGTMCVCLTPTLALPLSDIDWDQEQVVAVRRVDVVGGNGTA